MPNESGRTFVQPPAKHAWAFREGNKQVVPRLLAAAPAYFEPSFFAAFLPFFFFFIAMAAILWLRVDRRSGSCVERRELAVALGHVAQTTNEHATGGSDAQ
jgi:hypothetical protein